jgi:hypothetical protein
VQREQMTTRNGSPWARRRASGRCSIQLGLEGRKLMRVGNASGALMAEGDAPRVHPSQPQGLRVAQALGLAADDVRAANHDTLERLPCPLTGVGLVATRGTERSAEPACNCPMRGCGKHAQLAPNRALGHQTASRACVRLSTLRLSGVKLWRYPARSAQRPGVDIVFGGLKVGLARVDARAFRIARKMGRPQQATPGCKGLVFGREVAHCRRPPPIGRDFQVSAASYFSRRIALVNRAPCSLSAGFKPGKSRRRSPIPGPLQSSSAMRRWTSSNASNGPEWSAPDDQPQSIGAQR